MEFSPTNRIVQLCLQAMAMEEAGKTDQAHRLFAQAWSEAKHDFEKFMSAHFLSGRQKTSAEKLHWLQTALQHALKINDASVASAIPSIYTNIAQCHEDLNDREAAKRNHELARSSDTQPADQGPFYHGTKADLRVGEHLTPGSQSNYQDELKMNHIYFTALANGAGLAASLARGEARERVYIVEPTGRFENDPNVTNKKFPGNPTRSYRSDSPLKIIGELTEWQKPNPEELKKWLEKLASGTGEIII